MPLFSTPTQFAALGLVLIAGWLLGLASHPGGKKWKARYLAERDAHGALGRHQLLHEMAQCHGLEDTGFVPVEGGQFRQDAATAVDLVAQEVEVVLHGG